MAPGRRAPYHQEEHCLHQYQRCRLPQSRTPAGTDPWIGRDVDGPEVALALHPPATVSFPHPFICSFVHHFLSGPRSPQSAGEPARTSRCCSECVRSLRFSDRKSGPSRPTRGREPVNSGLELPESPPQPPGPGCVSVLRLCAGPGLHRRARRPPSPDRARCSPRGHMLLRATEHRALAPAFQESPGTWWVRVACLSQLSSSITRSVGGHMLHRGGGCGLCRTPQVGLRAGREQTATKKRHFGDRALAGVLPQPRGPRVFYRGTAQREGILIDQPLEHTLSVLDLEAALGQKMMRT